MKENIPVAKTMHVTENYFNKLGMQRRNVSRNMH